MLKNITFSADEDLIRRARERAADENTTLNEEFRQWLEKYIERPKDTVDFFDFMRRFDYANPGKKFTRQEMNDR